MAQTTNLLISCLGHPWNENKWPLQFKQCNILYSERVLMFSFVLLPVRERLKSVSALASVSNKLTAHMRLMNGWSC